MSNGARRRSLRAYSARIARSALAQVSAVGVRHGGLGAVGVAVGDLGGKVALGDMRSGMGT